MGKRDVTRQLRRGAAPAAAPAKPARVEPPARSHAAPARAPPRSRPAVAPVSSDGDGAENDCSNASPVVTSSDEGGSDDESQQVESGPDSTPPGSDSDDDCALDGWASSDEEEGDDAGNNGQRVDAAADDAPPATPAARPAGPPLASAVDNDGYASDSSLEGRPARNTAGAVPVEWYRAEPHVGYSVDGARLDKNKNRGDKLDALIARGDGGAALRTIYDEANGEDVTLTVDEVRMVRAIREGRFPHVAIDPFEPEDDWCSRVREIHPLNAAPEPKRRFAPSKWEEKAVVKLVRAIRRGWLKPPPPPPPPGTIIDPDTLRPWGGFAPTASLWDADGNGPGVTGAPLAYVPAPKPPPPGHAASYNPPPEYLPTDAEREAAVKKAEEAGEEDASSLPVAFDALRRVPAWANAARAAFERCLDLYLCPRSKRRTPFVADAASLLPDLPSPADLRPFPRRLAARLAGAGPSPLRAVCVDPAGQWIAAGGDGGVVTVWDAATGRRAGVARVGGAVRALAWRPAPRGAPLLAAAAGDGVVLLAPPGVGTDDQRTASAAALSACLEAAASGATGRAAAVWRKAGGDTLTIAIDLGVATTSIAWHGAGDYLVTTARSAPGARGVAVHRVSTATTQHPLRRVKAPPAAAVFHPTRPALLVGAGTAVRVYDLSRLALERKLIGGAGGVAAIAPHARGDHVVTAGDGGGAAWYDLDAGSRSHRVLRYHRAAIRSAAFHPTLPLLATAGDDGAAHVLHATVYSDLATPPLIVPLKVLPAHSVKAAEGALSVAWHPGQPWLYTAGADGCVCVWVD